MISVRLRLFSFLLVVLVQTSGIAADQIEGIWTGQVTAPDGRTAGLTLGFATGANGKLALTFEMPEMFCYQVKIGAPVEVTDGTYRFAPLDLTWRLDGDRLVGTFALSHLPMELKRGGEFSPAPVPASLPAGPAPLWTHDLGSITWASPVVQDGIVYVGARDGKFHAVRSADGSSVWSWVGPNRIDGRAVIAGDTVFFVDGKIEIVALNRADGSLRWRFPLHDAALAGKPAPENPTFNRRTAIPLVIGDVVYCGSSDGGLYAIEVATGQKRWRHDAGAPVFSGIGRDGENTLLFGCMDGSVVGLDRVAQKETFRAKAGGGVVTTPLRVGDRLVAGSRDYLLYGFDAKSGAVAWKFAYWFSWIESSPVLRDGVIYVGASDYRRVSAFDPATGRMLWGTDVRGMAWGSPVVTADTVFIGTAAQNIRGTVINHTGGIVALDRRTGAIKWQVLAPPPPENQFGGFPGTLALDGDRVIAAGFDGKLIALPVQP